jgi:ATP-dependent Clp endopeptidase proteolytic subunit ClpP
MSQASWFSIRRRTAIAAAAIGIAAAASAEVFIYGDIGESWWGETVAARTFVAELAALDVDQMTIRVNSLGGSVQDGVAIYNAIKRHKATVNVVIDAMAASIASLISLAGDTVEMADNALMMIHAPWGGVAGNAVAMREAADMLDQYSAAMATSYASKTGKTSEEVLALWFADGKDHFFTAQEALDAGLIDSIGTAQPVQAGLMLSLPLARFKTPHAALTAWMQNHTKTPEPTPAAPLATPAAPAAVLPAPAATLNKEPTMKTQEQIAAEQKAAVQAALAADATRRTEVRAVLLPLQAQSHISAAVTALLTTAEASPDMTVEQVKAQALDIMAKGVTPAAGGYVATVQTVEDEADKQRQGVQAALMIRANLAKNDATNPYRGHSLVEIARASLERSGVKTGHMDKMALVAAAFTHGTSDFTKLLANVANKAMLLGYEEAGETFQQWTSKGTLADFKAAKRVDLNTFPSLDNVVEGAEYKYGTIGDRGETVQLATYGKLFSITRQAIINDDLNAMAKVPRLMGRAAIRTVGNLVYAVLTDNPNMEDGNPLFGSGRGNLAAAGSAISTASVDALRVLMATQKDGKAILNLRMAYLLVPVALEGTANVVRNSEFEVGASSRNNTTPNSVRNTFEVVSDARLDAPSAVTWYGAGSPATTDTIEVSYLDGNEQPTLEEQNGWNVDGVEMKVRLDAGVRALSYRALAKNPGA